MGTSEIKLMGGNSFNGDRQRRDQEALLQNSINLELDHANEKLGVHPVRMRSVFVAAVLTVFTSSLGILTTVSQTSGGYKYDYSTVPFLGELLKLLVSMFLLWKESKTLKPPRITTDWRSVCLYPIPSIIYLIHNNVQFATLTYVDTSTYQIMGNLKIVTTAILFRSAIEFQKAFANVNNPCCSHEQIDTFGTFGLSVVNQGDDKHCTDGLLYRAFLKRKVSKLQWMAIALLTIGTTVSQVKGCGEADCRNLLAASIQGYLFGILSACLSAMAGVYTEFLMKKNQDSLHWQNIQLYAFGVLFNMIHLTLDDILGAYEKGVWWFRLLVGYNAMTWLVVFNLGFTGLLVSWVMKYADNIVKVYATSMAMLLTMVLSIYLFNFRPTLQLFLGILICCMSLQMYFSPPQSLLDLPTQPTNDAAEPHQT